MLLDIDKNGKYTMIAIVISSPRIELLLFVNMFLEMCFIFNKVVNCKILLVIQKEVEGPKIVNFALLCQIDCCFPSFPQATFTRIIK
jgi:hypothetical protein